MNNMIVAALVGIVALGFAVYKALSIQRVEAGTPRMAEIAGYIHDGAMAFLTREYKTLAMFVGVLFVVLSLLINLPTAIAFLVGAIFVSGGRILRHAGCNESQRAHSQCGQGRRNEQSPFRCLFRRCRNGDERGWLGSFGRRDDLLRIRRRERDR